MTEEVRISPDATHIVVTSTGAPSLAEMQQTLATIAQLRAEHGVDKVLVDSRARSGQPSVSEIYRGGELLADALGTSARIAVLVGRLERDHTFFENVAVNRGAVIAYFQSEELALRWLSENAS